MAQPPNRIDIVDSIRKLLCNDIKPFVLDELIAAVGTDKDIIWDLDYIGGRNAFNTATLHNKVEAMEWMLSVQETESKR